MFCVTIFYNEQTIWELFEVNFRSCAPLPKIVYNFEPVFQTLFLLFYTLVLLIFDYLKHNHPVE